jgi:hypothetical protein
MENLGAHYALAAIGFGAGIGYVVALAVEADDEHGAAMALAVRLIGSEDWRIAPFGRGVPDTLAKAAMAELVGAAKEFDGIVGIVGSEYGLHGAVVLVAKGEDVRPHAEASLADH